MSDELIVNDKQAMSALKKNGGNIVTAILAVLAIYFGWQFYQKNYAKIDTAAADSYTSIANQQEEINLAAQNPEVSTQVNTARTELYKDIDNLVATHGDTIYAWQALMTKASQQANANDYDGALVSLDKASKVNIDDKGLMAITNLQQAQLLLAKNEIDKALTIINGNFPSSFEPSRQEVLGDIYVAKKDLNNAKTAYQKAWDILKERGENRALLNLKMQSLGITIETIPSKHQVISHISQDNSITETTDETAEQSSEQ